MPANVFEIAERTLAHFTEFEAYAGANAMQNAERGYIEMARWILRHRGVVEASTAYWDAAAYNRVTGDIEQALLDAVTEAVRASRAAESGGGDTLDPAKWDEHRDKLKNTWKLGPN